MKKIIIILLFILCLINLGCFPVESTLHKQFKTVKEYAKWVITNVEYQEDILDYWKSPDEMIIDRKGDCEDYAMLTQAVLANLGIKSNLYFIAYKEGKETFYHTICIYEDKDKFSYFNNQFYIRSKSNSPQELVLYAYPTTIKIIICVPIRYGGFTITRNLLSYKTIWKK